MLFVLFPLATVLRSVKMAVGAVAVRLVILPVTVIDITIRMDQPSFAISFVISPVAFVEGAVGPDLDPLALSDLCLTQPFALVLSAALKQDHGATLSVPQLALKVVIVVQKVSQLLSHFLTDKKESNEMF